MSGTSAGWTPERRAAQAARMMASNLGEGFRAAKRKGWTEERRAAKRAEMIARNAQADFQDKRAAGLARRHTGARTVHTHPIVAGLFVEMRAQRATVKRVAEPAGVSPDTVLNWRRRHMPYLDLIDAALNVLGFEVAIVPIGTRDAAGFATKKSSTGE